jgi:hypothetical protein
MEFKSKFDVSYVFSYNVFFFTLISFVNNLIDPKLYITMLLFFISQKLIVVDTSFSIVLNFNYFLSLSKIESSWNFFFYGHASLINNNGI